MPDVQDRTIEVAVAAFQSDHAMLALWLEGSLAEGGGDPWSDVDLHVAVGDEDLDRVVGDGTALLGRIGEPIGFIEAPLPAGRLLAATLASPLDGHPVRVDLCVECRSAVAKTGRRVKPRVLFDRDGVAASLSESPALTFDPQAGVARLMRVYFFGAMWPWRMTGRRDWIGLAFNDVTVVAQFLVPLQLVAAGSPEFHREMTTRARFLPSEERRDLEQFLGTLFSALRGIERGEPDLDRLAEVHVRLLSRCLRAFRAACERTGLSYPERADAAYRAFYAQEMGRPVPA